MDEVSFVSVGLNLFVLNKKVLTSRPKFSILAIILLLP
jgi:hypothetical protein